MNAPTRPDALAELARIDREQRAAFADFMAESRRTQDAFETAIAQLRGEAPLDRRAGL